MEFAANSRKTIFDQHFRKGNTQEGFNVPPITDLILPTGVTLEVEPPLARHPDEEIVIEAPIVSRGPFHWEQLDPEEFDRDFLQLAVQEVTETDRVFVNPDLDAAVTITLEPTDTVQQTVTEILSDVDRRLSEDRALEKLDEEELETIRFLELEDASTVNISESFTAPTTKSAPKMKSKPMPKRPPTPPRGRGRSPAASPRGSVGRIDHSHDIDGVWLGTGDLADTRYRMMSFILAAGQTTVGSLSLSLTRMTEAWTSPISTKRSPKF